MKKFSRQDAIYQLALASIAAALATVFVTLGVYVRFSTIAFFIAAGLALMIPLARRYWFASIAAFAVSAVAAFFIAGDIYAVAGYVVYFGPAAILCGALYNLKVKWYIQIPIKLVYINGALALLYFVLKTVVIDASIMKKVPYYAIALVGSVVLIAIDLVLQFIYSRCIPLLDKVLRRVSKGKKTDMTNDGNDIVENDDDPFDEELYTDIYKRPADEENIEDENDELTLAEEGGVDDDNAAKISMKGSVPDDGKDESASAEEGTIDRENGSKTPIKEAICDNEAPSHNDDEREE